MYMIMTIILALPSTAPANETILTIQHLKQSYHALKIMNNVTVEFENSIIKFDDICLKPIVGGNLKSEKTN